MPLPGGIESSSGSRDKDRRVLALASGAVPVTQVHGASGGGEEGVAGAGTGEDAAVSAACAAAAAMAAAACEDAEAQFKVLRNRSVRRSSTWAHSDMAAAMAAAAGAAGVDGASPPQAENGAS